MKPAKTFKKISYPNSWAEITHGGWVKQQMQEQLDEYCKPHFGYHLLKLGALSAELNCHSSQIQHQVNVGESTELCGIQANLDALPFQEGAIDLCLLAHTLDYCSDPHQILREVERVLTADGVIIISGFNPLSYLGLARYLPYFKKQLPWSGRMFSPQRVKDWLNLLGFELIEHKQLAYFSLSGNTPKTCIGDRYCRSLGFIYILVAKKRRSRLTPIKNRWQIKRHLGVPELKGLPKVK